ncbi:MAG TPA: urea carboxylase-associated family protein, partial [Burkholderiales bacterium]
MKTLEDTVVPARGSWSRSLAKGETLRIVDLEGKQAVDFLCYNAHDHADRYAAADTMKINASGIFLSTGTVLYSVGLTPLFTIVADTCGKHDT